MGHSIIARRTLGGANGAIIKSIQIVEGATPTANGQPDILTIPIAVDMSKTIVFHTFRGVSSVARDNDIAQLISPTEINVFGGTNGYIICTVIEFESGINVQRITGTTTNTGLSVNVGISEVDPTKAFFIGNGHMVTSDSGSNTEGNMTCVFNSPTSVQMRRTTQGGIKCTGIFQVVEFE